MRIAIASDHTGLELRRRVREQLESQGHQVTDLGPDDPASVDYPDFAADVARHVAANEVDRGILICGTGFGMQIAANKVPGVRAVTPYDETTTKMSRLHNDSNVACFGARAQDPEQVLELTTLWLDTPFEGGRHQRRVDKIRQIEEGER